MSRIGEMAIDRWSRIRGTNENSEEMRDGLTRWGTTRQEFKRARRNIMQLHAPVCARTIAASAIFVSRRGRDRVQKTSRGVHTTSAVFNSRDAAVAHTPLHIVGECAIRYTFFHRSPTRLLFLQSTRYVVSLIVREIAQPFARFIKRKPFLSPFFITCSSISAVN